METSEAVTQILDRAPGALLEKARFGRSESALYRLAGKHLPEIARALKEEAGFDWLEDLSAMQTGSELALTYFARSASATLILRVGVPIGERKGPAGIDDDGWARAESVSAIWRMATPHEAEISRLFGVKFLGGIGSAEETATQETGAKETGAKETWNGFPLRKSFEVIGETATGGVSP